MVGWVRCCRFYDLVCEVLEAFFAVPRTPYSEQSVSSWASQKHNGNAEVS